jgi:hypothetical protein
MACSTTSGIPMLGCCSPNYCVARIVNGHGYISFPIQPITDELWREMLSGLMQRIYDAVIAEPFPEPTAGNEGKITLRAVTAWVRVINNAPSYDPIGYATYEGQCTRFNTTPIIPGFPTSDYDPQYAGWLWSYQNVFHNALARKIKVVCPEERKICVDVRTSQEYQSNGCYIYSLPPTENVTSRFTESELIVMPATPGPVTLATRYAHSTKIVTLGTNAAWVSPCNNAP